MQPVWGSAIYGYRAYANAGWRRYKMQTENERKKPLQHVTKWLSAALEKHPVIFIFLLACTVTLAVEVASRHSLWKGLVFLFTHPLHFVINMAIILVTLAIGLFFKKRIFFLSFFVAVWMGLGIVNAIMLKNRVTPFNFSDITLLPTVFPIIDAYMEFWQILLAIVGIVLVIALLVVIFVKTRKFMPSYRLAAICFVAAVIVATGSYSLTVIGHEEDRNATFANISEAYRQYGFVYCFCTGVFDRGIGKPEFYSKASVNWLLGTLHETPEPTVLPNIVMVQLESFFDVSYLDNVIYEENPLPTFTYLKKNYSSGFLTVPSVGAGTANTEFEVLSGMSLGFFGMGEYPYKTILQEEACETIATNLKSLGYSANAIHNNTGTFYKRNKVFDQLGFDTFTSIEYMENVEYNPIGWAKDYVLTEEIMKALDSTRGPNFVFAISVQGHGKYQRGVDSEEMEDLGITWEDHESESAAFAYYVSQLSEMDEFIGELVNALGNRAEPTVLVLYGDHLPSFDIGAEQLENGDIFQTEYVIWSNFDLPKEDKNLKAYQLSAEVLGRLSISNGILTKYHQQMADSEDYSDGLRLLEYDMLYGKFYCFGGENLYTSSGLQMGIEPITISDAVWQDGVLTVYGENFTQWSHITIDGTALDTVILDSETLTAELKEPPADGAIVTVRQLNKSSVPLSESVGFIFNN